MEIPFERFVNLCYDVWKTSGTQLRDKFWYWHALAVLTPQVYQQTTTDEKVKCLARAEQKIDAVMSRTRDTIDNTRMNPSLQ